MEKQLADTFLALPELFGQVEVIETAKAMTGNPRSLAAITRLENLYRILGYYGLSDYVSFDLGMLGKYRYYTGIIFRGVTFGMGEPIVSGGRYDGLMRQFGKEAPSVGFSISIDGLMSALSRQKIDVEIPQIDYLFLYDKEEQEQAVLYAAELRKKGKNLQLIRKKEKLSVPDYRAYGERNGMETMLYLTKGQLFLYRKGESEPEEADRCDI